MPLVTRIAAALGHWLGESFGGNLRLAPDLDEVPALSIEREALWKRVGEAAFLTDDEKRAAAGYEPLPASSLATLLAKYDPNQPRVPAGNPDGGQWTAEGRPGRVGTVNDDRVASDVNEDQEEFILGEQYAQRNTPLFRLRNGRVVRPEQAQELAQAEARLREIVRQVQQYDPNWRPQPTASSTPATIESQINTVNSIAQEAQARLNILRSGIGGNFGPPLTPPTAGISPYVPPRTFDGPAHVDLYRAVFREPDLFGRDTWDKTRNTVAVTEISGTVVYGVNSSAPGYDSKDLSSARELRDRLITRYPDSLHFTNPGWIPNDSFFHAETTLLLRAARLNGGSLSGRFVDIYVDNEVCTSCNIVLPLLAQQLGNPTIRFRDPSGKIIILRNGVWETR